MGEEKYLLDKNGTRDVVERPQTQIIIGCKWVYKNKEGIPGVEDP